MLLQFETPNFISTVGSSADFLKIDNTNITFIESGAVAIAGITTDYDNEVRAGNTGLPFKPCNAPDIGADEFDGKLPYVIVSNSNALSDGSYAKLSLAFAAINANLQTSKKHCGNFNWKYHRDFDCNFKSRSLDYKNISQKTGLSISGNIAGFSIIDFNGADNVTLDGR
jgi:hypothetical protein